MSLSPKNLSSIQKAGQAAHDASEALATTVRTQAVGMVSNLASQPYSAETDQVVSRFKTLSKLSQGLAAVEAQLQELFAIANELASPASDVIVVRAITKRKAISNDVAVDVVAKPAKAAKKVKRGGRKAAALTVNDTKLLNFLQKALKNGKATTLTGNAMADGSGMPVGSVGLSLKKIIGTGAVNMLGRGTYQLGTTFAPAAEPIVKATPAKKAKPVVAKKVKAVVVEAPAAKEVKAKPVKVAKVAPEKKVKAPSAKKVKVVAEAAAPAVVTVAPAVESETAPV